MFSLIIILAVLASAAICFYRAKARNADTRHWTTMGIIFGPFAIPFAFFSSPIDKPKHNKTK